MRVVTTNWINVLGVFITVFIYAVILNINDEQGSITILQAMFSAFVLVVGYGLLFWGAFIIALIVFDFVLINKSQSNLQSKLLIEWLIISSPFIYGAIKYSEWIFIAAVIAFLITQLLREKRIVQIR